MIPWGKLLVRTISHESRNSHNWTENREFILIWYPGALWVGTKGILFLSKQIPKKRWPGVPPSSSSSLFIMAHYGTTGTLSMLQSLCQSQLWSANMTAWNIWFLTQAVKGCPFLPWSWRSWHAHQRLQKTSAFQLARSSVLSGTQFVTRGMPCNVAQSSYKALAAISFTKKNHSFLCCSSPVISYTQYILDPVSMESHFLFCWAIDLACGRPGQLTV